MSRGAGILAAVCVVRVLVAGVGTGSGETVHGSCGNGGDLCLAVCGSVLRIAFVLLDGRADAGTVNAAAGGFGRRLPCTAG